MTTQSEESNSLDGLQIRKTELEIKKLEKEIKDLNKSIFLNPNNWGNLIALCASLFVLTWAVCTGWFSNQKADLKRINEEFNFDVKKFNDERAKIQDTISLYKSKQKSIQDSFDYVKDFVSKEQNKISSLMYQDSILRTGIAKAVNKNIKNNTYNPLDSKNKMLITGTLIDSLSNNPIVNATIYLESKKTVSGEIVKTVSHQQSNLAGFFLFNELPRGDCYHITITIVKVPYRTIIKEFEIIVGLELDLGVIKLVQRNHSDGFTESFN